MNHTGHWCVSLAAFWNETARTGGPWIEGRPRLLHRLLNDVEDDQDQLCWR
jgi:hypothetical protein